MKRKICVITGTRAEYGLLKPVLNAIKKDHSLELLLMVTAMHLSEEFGRTADSIKKDGFRIDFKVNMNTKDDKPASMAISIGKGIIGMARAFTRNRPDIVVILGDRIEALAGAISAAYLNIPVAHIHGGDISAAGLDEYARHAITKMSNIHFAASKKSMERVIAMGENPEYTYLTGAPGIDSIFHDKLFSKRQLEQKYHLDLKDPYLLLLQHSVTTESQYAKRQINETLDAIKELKMHTIIIYPNSDTGGRTIIQEIEKLIKLSFIDIFKNIPHPEYLSLQRYAAVLIGNSSGGIIESSSFGLPVINIGIRQKGRERSCNVIDAGHDTRSIVVAVKKALYDNRFRSALKRCKNPYGDGHASERIVRVLRKIKIDENLLQKRLNY